MAFFSFGVGMCPAALLVLCVDGVLFDDRAVPEEVQCRLATKGMMGERVVAQSFSAKKMKYDKKKVATITPGSYARHRSASAAPWAAKPKVAELVASWKAVTTSAVFHPV